MTIVIAVPVRYRVLVGLSITAAPQNGELIEIIEPNASSIPDRMAVMVEAAAPGLRLCQEALGRWGYEAEAESIGKIRKRQNWSRYVVDLLANVRQSIRRHSDIAKLRFLLYPSRLLGEDEAQI